MHNLFDFDIDISPKSLPDKSKYGTRAMVYNEKTETIQPHPSGVYLEDVPVDEVTGLCAFDYHYGDEHGFIKVDILNNSAYDRFTSKDEVLKFLHQEPNWDILKKESIVEKLPHIGNYYDLVQELEPRSIEDLADLIALIRPGKRDLLDQYKENKLRVRNRLLYTRSKGHYFKKAHAISYAAMIVLVMNRLSLFSVG